MANTYEAVLDNNVANDAEWQAWCQGIEAAILASGFFEVAPDTGQLNLATVTRPALGTFAGYRIYRAKDSLAATKPYYAKVEFGNTGSGQDRPIFRRTMGTGSNGAGTLTGPNTAPISTSNSAAGSGAQTILAGGGPHAMWLWANDPGSSSHAIFWFTGRLREQVDASPSNEVFVDNLLTSSFILLGAYFHSDGVAAWVQNTNGLASHMPDLNAGLNSGGNINTTLVYQALVYRNAKTLVFPLVTGRTAELPYTNPASSKFSLNIWGGNHTFLPIPVNAGASAQRLALLWE